MLSFKQTVRVLKAADFIVIIDADGRRHVASSTCEVDSGADASDFSVVVDTIDDIDFKWEQKYELSSYRCEHNRQFMRGFYINYCWVFPVKAGRA